jgi:hypothetical protein
MHIFKHIEQNRQGLLRNHEIIISTEFSTQQSTRRPKRQIDVFTLQLAGFG